MTTTICSTGHRILARVKSHKKLRMAAEEEKLLHRRQHSDPSDTIVSRLSSATSSDAHCRSHYPPIEFDPLKLNPPVSQIPRLPTRQHGSFQGSTLGTNPSFGGHQLRRPRLHHSESGFSIDVQEGFDFGFEKEQALKRHLDNTRSPREAIFVKGWPSPVSSEGSCFHDSDDEDEEGLAKRGASLIDDTPRPRARPQVGPDNYLKRGVWKRRGIVFGGQQQSEEVFTHEKDAFDFGTI